MNNFCIVDTSWIYWLRYRASLRIAGRRRPRIYHKLKLHPCAPPLHPMFVSQGPWIIAKGSHQPGKMWATLLAILYFLGCLVYTCAYVDFVSLSPSLHHPHRPIFASVEKSPPAAFPDLIRRLETHRGVVARTFITPATVDATMLSIGDKRAGEVAPGTPPFTPPPVFPSLTRTLAPLVASACLMAVAVGPVRRARSSRLLASKATCHAMAVVASFSWVAVEGVLEGGGGDFEP